MTGHLFHELTSRFPRDTPTIGFYVFHGICLWFLLKWIRRASLRVRSQYLEAVPPNAVDDQEKPALDPGPAESVSSTAANSTEAV